MSLPRYRPQAWQAFAGELLAKASLPAGKAEAVAGILVEGELLGRTTHGLALLAPYLKEIETGGMTVAGDPEVVNDFGACLTWNGRKLPGPWLIMRALDEAMGRAARFGLGAVAIQRSHHAACLGAYLGRAAERGFMALITLTDPGFSSVAPFGGVKPVLTSNPLAFTAPTAAGPILIDMSTSMATNATLAKMQREGRSFPSPFLLDAKGTPSADPGVVLADPPGTVLPLGGLEAGHKGYGLGLMIELLSGCLCGHGRAEPREGWSAAVLVLAFAPAAFGGEEACRRQVDWLVEACRGSEPRPGVDRVRVPGEAGMERRAAGYRDGIAIAAEVIEALRPWAAKLGVRLPEPVI